MKLKIALTGGIGSGKSYIAKILKLKYDIDVISSDVLAKQLMEHNEILNEKIVKLFGRCISIQWVTKQ